MQIAMIVLVMNHDEDGENAVHEQGYYSGFRRYYGGMNVVFSSVTLIIFNGQFSMNFRVINVSRRCDASGDAHLDRRNHGGVG